MTSENAVSVLLENISFKYNKRGKMVLEDISLKLHRSESICLMGINGSGKSTLLKIITGTIKPIQGMIHLNNIRIKNVNKARRHVIIVPENAKLFLIGPTPYEDLFRIIRDKQEVSKLYEEMSLSSLMNKKIYHLSEGERRLFAIINAFQTNDSIILLDEPTIGLDKRGRKLLFNLIESAKEKGKTVLIASNDPRMFVDLDRLVVIKDGRVKLDSEPREVLYELESQTNLIPNQIVRFIQAMENELKTKLPHFIKSDELNEYLRRCK